MNIAIIAHDQKKELLVQFCMVNCATLSKHTLLSTATTGKFVSGLTGLKFELFLSGNSGGMEQIGSKIAYNEVDLLLFFRDPTIINDPEGIGLLRLCDMHNVPVATNITTAEIMMKAIETKAIKSRANSAPYENPELDRL
jgi:methylglyoxal synthase